METDFVLTEQNGVRGYTDGIRFYPSVSAILDLLMPSKHQWIDVEDLDEGTRLHRAMKECIEGYLATSAWPVPTDPRVRALVNYLQQYGFVPLEAERTRVSDRGFAGTPDALLMQRFGATILHTLPDWKFSEGLDERYEYQLMAYEFLFEEPVDKSILFRVGKDCIVKPHVVKKRPQYKAEFLNALAVMKVRLR